MRDVLIATQPSNRNAGSWDATLGLGAQRGPPRRHKQTLRPARRGTPRRYKQPPRLSPASRWRAGWPTCRPRGGGNRPSSGCTTAACGWTSTQDRDGGDRTYQSRGQDGCGCGITWCVCSDVARCVALPIAARDRKITFLSIVEIAIAFSVGAMPSVASARPNQCRIVLLPPLCD